MLPLHVAALNWHRIKCPSHEASLLALQRAGSVLLGALPIVSTLVTMATCYDTHTHAHMPSRMEGRPNHSIRQKIRPEQSASACDGCRGSVNPDVAAAAASSLPLKCKRPVRVKKQPE